MKHKATTQKKLRIFKTCPKMKIMGMIAAALFVGSCNNEKLPEMPKVELKTTNVTINNNSTELSQRVTMYGNIPSVIKSSEASELSMPSTPPTAQYDYVLDRNYKSWEVAEGKNYYMAQGTTHATDIQFRNNVYYIDGELTITNFWGTGTLVILPGGKVNYPSHMPVDRLEILNYGSFNIINGDKFVINDGASFKTIGDLFSTELIVSGNLYVGNGLGAVKMDAQETSKCHLACGATISEYLIVHNYADMYLGSYLSAPLIEMNSASLLKIKAKGLVKTERLNMKNPCTIAVIGEELDYAVLSADVIEINQSDVKQMFTGWMDIHYKEIENKSGSELEWLSSIKFNGNTYLAKDKCRPAFGQEPAIEEKPETGIEHIAQIETPDHGHYISATCIQTSAGKAYVSYHTQGTDYHGCIEALEYTGDNCSILSYMEHPDLDFNHLIIDNNRIITAGDNPKKGAFLGIINLQGGIFQTSSPEFTQIKLEGASANCVIRNGSYLHATTNDGYHTLENDTYYTVSSVASAGSSKFIDANGSNMGILSLSDKDSEQSMATLRVFNTSDYTYSSPVHTMNMDIITPTNGKNVLRIDGNDVYVCLGRNGVKRYTNGAESASFKLEDDSKAAANGLAVDNNYVYVAYGNGGLFILNKSDLSLVASYRHSGGKSANYVTVNGNVLYVAYGLNGVQVFKFITK